MVIGDLSANVAYGNLRLQKPFTPERQPITLDAKLDPKKPNEYSVLESSPVIAPPDKAAEAKNTSKRAPQNTDRASRAFHAVENFQSNSHRIDLFV